MRYVIDCSVAFKWVVAESDTPKAVKLRDDFRNAVHDLLAPDLFPTEMANALLVSERRGRLSPGDSTVLLKDILKTLPVIHAALPDLLPRAHGIAASSVASVYDGLYVALAEREGCELVTADDKLVKNLQATFPFIVALASFP
jgi:predicted nucleic acid-binding protein